MPIDALGGWPPPVLDPAGPYASSVSLLAWALFAMGGTVFLIVLGALGIAIFGSRQTRDRLGGERVIWIGGVAFPFVVLTALLIWGLTLSSRLSAEISGNELRMRVTGEMWWWRVAYLDGQGREVLQDANELHIPAGQPIVLELESADVIHSFWVPRLSGKLDMIPGRRNLLRIQADAPGVFGGQCAEYCGGPHALMGFVVVAHSPENYRAWRAAQVLPPAAPVTPQAQRGAALFASTGCASCHAVRGTAYNGLAGPDLSRVGARRTLGAGILPNNRGALTGWIANSQAIKPGNRMPPYDVLTGQDLQAITAYVEGLK